MDLEQLEYFRVVARVQHVTRAAAEIAISQPALSRSIARLEAEVGVPLFDRRGRAIRLNRYGEAFLAHAERVLREIEAARRAVADLAGPERGTVPLGFLHSLGVELVPSLVGAFRAGHPAVGFELHQAGKAVILDELRAGAIELALVSGPVDDPELAFTELYREPLWLWVPPDHALAGRRRVSMPELAGEPFVMLGAGHGLREIVDDYCRAAGFEPRVAFEGEDASTLRGLVAAGLGIAILPPADEGGAARAIADLRPRCARSVGLVCARDRYTGAATRLFQAFVVDRFRASVS